MQRKVFWISFMILSLGADLVFPLMWGIVSTAPLLFFCWWLAYKSDWFE